MSRRIIPGLCALALAVPAAAVAQPAHNPPAVQSGVVAYGDTKYDLQNQRDQKAPAGVTAYEQAISGDTKGDLPRAIAPAPDKPATKVTGVDRVGSLSWEQLAAAYGTRKPAVPADQVANAYGATAPNARFVPAAAASDAATSHDDTTDGWQIAALAQAALLAACALGAAVVMSGRARSRRLGT